MPRAYRGRFETVDYLVLGHLCDPLAFFCPWVAADREMVHWFGKSAPMGSRHQRMLWAAHKIADLTWATEGGAYQMLLVALIETEKQLEPWEFNDCA